MVPSAQLLAWLLVQPFLPTKFSIFPCHSSLLSNYNTVVTYHSKSPCYEPAPKFIVDDVFYINIYNEESGIVVAMSV